MQAIFEITNQHKLRFLPRFLALKDYNTVHLGLKDKRGVEMIGLAHRSAAANMKSGLLVLTDITLKERVIEIIKACCKEDCAIYERGAGDSRMTAREMFLRELAENESFMSESRAFEVTCAVFGMSAVEAKQIMAGA